nr:cyclic nucleotide-binding domain-containing protein [Marinobacter changyiensis]
MDSIPTRSLHAISSSCDRCSLSSLCLPLAVGTGDMSLLNAAVKRETPYDRGSAVFTQDATFESCYVVKSGAVKTVRISERGDEKILGFYLPGEMFGLDGLTGERYTSSAIALERSAVCEIPFHRLEELSRELPHLQHYLFRLMSQEISGAEQLGMLLSNNTAEERIISMFLTLSSRQARRKLSATRFRLPMARGEIANFLGLALETVSRVLSRMQKQQQIRLDGRDIELLDLDALQRQLRQNPDFCVATG